MVIEEEIELSGKKTDENGDLSIAWRNLQFCVLEYDVLKFKQRKKAILRGLTGQLRAGSLGGLMGPSAAGKTTLLECLSGNKRAGIAESSHIYINSSLKSSTSYFIAQHVHENIIGQLTVGQILRYAFRFKNGAAGTEGQLRAHINAIMAALLLPPELESRRFARCSGGEQKRVAIAQELMALNAPTFLFIDEPTTGLDSQSAFEVMLCLQKLARSQHITVVASIHAPNDDTLNLFDKLYVLAKGGVCIYSGPPKQIRSYLESQLELSIAPEQPPVEALIKIACSHLDTPNIIALATHTQRTQSQCLSPEIPHLASIPFGLPNSRRLFSLFTLATLTLRHFRSTFISDHRLFTAQILIHILNVLFLSSLFNNDMALPSGCYPLDNDSRVPCQTELEQNARISENINFHVFCGAIEGFVITCSSTLLFASIVKVFNSEYRNKWYSLGVFYLSVNVIAVIEITIYVLSISTTAYLATSQQAIDNYSLNWTRFGQFVLCIWLLGLYAQSLGQLIGVIVMHSPTLAVVTAIMIYMTMDIMNDFLFKTDEFDSQLLVTGSNVVALKYVTKYMIAVLYDRCAENEFSVVLMEHHTKTEDIWFYIRRIVENVLVMRLATLVTLYFKFNAANFAPNCFRRNQRDLQSDETFSIEFNPVEIVDLKKPVNGISRKIEGDTANETIIGWKNVSLSSSSNKFAICSSSAKEKLILRNLSGQFKYGTLNGCMGTSGSGKSTLLRVLNGRHLKRLSAESRFFLGNIISTCFIMQEVSEHLMPGLTARQMLFYASRLKNVGKDVNHEQIALKWLDELDLMATGDTKVEKCSGGERKRLAVALELTSIEMPNLIFIDEPTSGLDSNSAEIVISTLRQLTISHTLTIVTSIHQPTTEVLYMFDQLYVLARGGVCIYSGPSDKIQVHLEQVTSIQPATYNFPIEELIKISCRNWDDEIVRQLVETTDNLVKSSPTLETLQETKRLAFRSASRFSLGSVGILSLRYFALFSAQLWKEYLLFYLILLSYASSLHIFWSSDIAYTSGCLNIEKEYLNGSCTRSANQLKQDQNVDNMLKFNFFMNNIFLLLILLQSSLSLFNEVPFFCNECRNGWYSISSFYLKKAVVEIVPLLPMILLYIYMCDIYSKIIPGLYWHFLLIIVLSIYASYGMAHLIVLLANGHIAVLTLVFMIVYDCFLLLSNFFVNVHRLNLFYRVISYFSISRWAFEAVLLLIFGFGRCEAGVEVHPVLEWLMLKDEDYWFCIGMLVANCALFRVISFALLLLKTNSLTFGK